MQLLGSFETNQLIMRSFLRLTCFQLNKENLKLLEVGISMMQ